MYRASDFDYPLPRALIAQDPLPERAASRLLVLDRASGDVRHRHFAELPALVAPGDVLVLNVSRVIPARLRGTREGGAAAELLLVRELPDGTWLALGHPGGKLKPGRQVRFGDDSAAEIVAVLGGGLRQVRFVGRLDALGTLAKHGEVPLPPYIRRAPRPEDRERYQTVYAVHPGSVAAPTAGLHFTPEQLSGLRAAGVAVAELDLHVGPGTFKPVETEDLASHPMDPERYRVSDETARLINARRAAGGRVWAVGTTVVRTLETCADEPTLFVPGRRPAAHQFSSAPLDLAHAGVRVRRL
jgi:S-adenosylmethionine:tRNA ribosyltransferase-isomerase